MQLMARQARNLDLKLNNFILLSPVDFLHKSVPYSAIHLLSDVTTILFPTSIDSLTSVSMLNCKPYDFFPQIKLKLDGKLLEEMICGMN
jgi:hypothetical protein